eukprot:148803-Pyramimonas_sp.AAC.1
MRELSLPELTSPCSADLLVAHPDGAHVADALDLRLQPVHARIEHAGHVGDLPLEVRVATGPLD